MIGPLQAEIERRLSSYVFGTDADTPQSVVHDLLQSARANARGRRVVHRRANCRCIDERPGRLEKLRRRHRRIRQRGQGRTTRRRRGDHRAFRCGKRGNGARNGTRCTRTPRCRRRALDDRHRRPERRKRREARRSRMVRLSRRRTWCELRSFSFAATETPSSAVPRPWRSTFSGATCAAVLKTRVTRGREPGHAVAKGRRGGAEARMPGAPTKRVAFSHEAKMRASPCRRVAGLSPMWERC